MNLQQLKVFILTAQTGKLAKAAETLQLKQPTITFHLNRLQESLGVQLFSDSASKSWVLSDAGKALYHYAVQIVHLVEKSETIMKEYQSLKRGKVYLGASYTPASYILPPYLADFQNQHEEVYISLMVKKAPSILERVLNYELDLGVVAYGKLDDPELTVIPVMEDELVLIMHPDHPLATVKDIQTHHLTAFPFILHEEKSISRILTDQWMGKNQIDLKIMMEIGSIKTITEGISANIGLSIVPRLSVQSYVKEGRLLAKELPNYVNERYIYIIYRKNQLFTPLMETFIRFLSDSLIKNTGSEQKSNG